MAYHYLLHSTGDTRVIRTESLEQYRGTSWQIFDTEAERDAVQNKFYYAVHFTLSKPHKIAAYQKRDYERAAYHLFDTEQEAQAWFAANPPRWFANPLTGQAQQGASSAPIGYTSGPFASKAEAVASVAGNQLWALDTSNVGEWRRIWPYHERQYQEASWVTGQTKEECTAQIPVRWRWTMGDFGADRNGRWPMGENVQYKYQRALSGMARLPSRYHIFRQAIAAIARGENEYPVTGGIRNETRSYNAERIIHEAIVNSQTLHAQRGLPMPDYVARLNRIAGAELFFHCDGAGDNACTLPVHALSPYDAEGHRYCQNCRRSFSACAVCNVLMHPDDAIFDDDDRCTCAAHVAVPTPLQADGQLANYSTDVLRHLKGFELAPGEKASIWLGFELECYARPALSRSSVIKAVQSWPYCICKKDSSVHEGFEIVSIPASLRWHQNNTRPWLAAINQKLEGWNHKDCGIHVHVGVKELSDLTKAKLVVFMHAKENQDFLDNVAGRGNNSYTKRAQELKRFMHFKSREADLGKYQALNFATRGNKTIEFRLFQSNVAVQGFMKNLEFVHALVAYCTVASMHEVGTGQGIKSKRNTQEAHAGLVQYVIANRGLYPALYAWMEGQEYVKGPVVDFAKMGADNVVRFCAKHGNEHGTLTDHATAPVENEDEDEDEDESEPDYDFEPEEENAAST